MVRRLLCYLVNSLCCLMYRKEYQEFLRLKETERSRLVNLKAPVESGRDTEAPQKAYNDQEVHTKKVYYEKNQIKKVQAAKLFQILRANQSCEYGKRCDFENLTTIEEFQKKVPLTVYEDYLEDIERIRRGEKNILTSEEILLLEPSSGSTSASKLIPYTKSLKEEFQKGIRPWIYDLYQHVPGIKWGQSYWSVTPAAAKKESQEGGVTVGFEDDKAYFGRIENKLFDLIFAVPSKVARAKTIEEFYEQTVLGLLNCPGLTFISIWNPSFLLLLLEYIEKNAARLAVVINRRSKRRGAEVQRILAQKTYAKLWPNLKVISCWADAQAQFYAQQLKEIFPDVLIQPKGLLATEGFVSFPLLGKQDAALSVKSHFFEFAACDAVSGSEQKIYLASELEAGREYAVILTTSGGLYRYQLKDIVLVTGFFGTIPLLKFVSKEDRVSDLFGEKLNERFVQNALAGIVLRRMQQGVMQEESALKADFLMLSPEKDHYVLYIRSNQALQVFKDTGERIHEGLQDLFYDKPCDALADRLDEALRANFHYDYCRRLGQLKPVRIFRLTGRPEREYLTECMKRGQRLGDIKPVTLHLQGGWDQVFEGEYL